VIKRVNLIEKKAFAFTYLRLVQFCLVIIIFNFALVGYQIYRAKRFDANLVQEQKILKTLEQQRDELMKKPVKKRVSVGQYQELFDAIETTPSWSKLLSDMSERLPNTVWLTNFKSVSSMSGAPQTQKKQSKSFRDKNKDKAKPETKQKIVKKHMLEVNGLGADMRNITEFTALLEQSKYFKNLTLAESSKQAFGISFTIRSEITSNAR